MRWLRLRLKGWNLRNHAAGAQERRFEVGTFHVVGDRFIWRGRYTEPMGIWKKNMGPARGDIPGKLRALSASPMFRLPVQCARASMSSPT